jgi:3D (Asp-Asp-Asp) domain-containing protein
MINRLSRLGTIVFKTTVVLISIIVISIGTEKKEILASNLFRERTAKFEYKYIDYEIIERYNYNLPLFDSVVLIEGEKGIVATSGDGKEEIVIQEPINKIIEIGMGNPENFTSDMTGYGPDCVGCRGRVACPPHKKISYDNIYYYDSDFDELRIVAADRTVPCGTIVEISGFRTTKFLPDNNPIRAIVLDRGGAIKGKKLDLLFRTEKETLTFGYQRNINVQILRWGWE